MNNEFGFTCLACGQFRPGPEGAHSEAECLRVQMDSLRRQLAAVTAERDRLREALEWRPIASAPKDETWVEVGRYINGVWEYCKSAYCHDSGNPMEGEPPCSFWAEDYDSSGVTDDIGMDNAYWRPISDGPSLKGADDEQDD